jgi:hypothetical protein
MIDARRGEFLDLSKSEASPSYVRLSPGVPDPYAVDRLRRLAAERRDRLEDPGLTPTDGPFDATWESAQDVERHLDGDPPAGWCGLCGGYGAASERGEPRECIGCGKKAEFAIVMPLNMLNPDEPTFSGPQHHGLRLLDGGA